MLFRSNSELHEELPGIYAKKMKSLLMGLQNYFAIQAHYHSEAGKLLATTSDVIDELPSVGVMQKRAHPAASGRQIGAEQEEIEEEEDEEEEEEEEDEDEEDNCGPVGKESNGAANGGGSSSGMGSSRADSSCPETCSSSSGAGSPDSAARLPAANARAHLHQQAQGERAEEEKIEQKAEQVSGDELFGVVVSDELQASGSTGGEAAHERQQVAATASIATDLGELRADGINSAGSCLELADQLAGKFGPAKEATFDHHEAGQAEAKQVGASTGGELVEQVAESELAKEEEEEEEKIGEPVAEAEEQEIPEKLAEAEEQQKEVGRAEQQEHGAEPSNVPTSGFLYKVRTNYKYLAEDVDELCFEADEVIQVVEFDESHEPEEGWLMGLREATNQRGLFPANFTRPI